MVLKKIKDLIREMIFENQSDEYEYTHVMANLVFDDINDFERYDAILENTENTKVRYDENIQHINTNLDNLKAELVVLTSKKKSGQDLSQQENKKLIELSKKIKELTKTQRLTIEEKIQHGFGKLNPVIKKYACLRYLANKYIKNADFQTESGKDGFLYIDESMFKSSEMVRNFHEISDYVDYIFGNRETKIVEPKSVIDVIKNDAKNLGLIFEKLTIKDIVSVYRSLWNRIAIENRNKQTEQEQIKQSHIGIKPVKDFGNGLVMYRLLPDTEYYKKHHLHRNLVYEGDQTGTCTGDASQTYSQKIFDEDVNQYYSLRSMRPNGRLIPHCTIEVKGDIVSQIRGKANEPVNGKYIKQVREFLKDYLNVAFPGEDVTGKRRLEDFGNIGFLQDTNGDISDVFDIKKDIKLRWVFYDVLMITGLDTTKIKYINKLRFGQRRVNQNNLDLIPKNIWIDNIEFFQTKLQGNLKFTNGKTFTFRTLFFNEAEGISFGSNIEHVQMNQIAFNSPKYVDFTGVKNVSMEWVMLDSLEYIKFDEHTENVEIYNATFCPKKLNFSGAKHIKLRRVDFNGVKDVIFGLNAEDITLWSVANLLKYLDFCGAKNVFLKETDFDGVEEIVFGMNIDKVEFISCKNLPKYLDCKGVKFLNLSGTSLSKTEKIFVSANTKITGLDDMYKNKIEIVNVLSNNKDIFENAEKKIIVNNNDKTVGQTKTNLNSKCNVR